MRISTPQLYSSALDGILKQQQRLSQLNQEMASGRRILSPADDPAGSARVVDLTANIATLDSYDQNASFAVNSLSQESDTLQQVGDLVRQVRTLALQMANGTQNDQTRSNAAAEVGSQLSQLLQLANTRDGNGNYLFAGTVSGTQPFALQSGTPPVSYSGDSGQQALQINATRRIPVADSGQAVFMDIADGNGTFSTAATSGNTGTATVGAGSVLDPQKAATQFTANATTYTITFSSGTTGTSYSVTSGSGASLATVASGTYTPGMSITIPEAGIQVDFQGDPSNGDTFTVAPSKRQDLFSTLNQLQSALSMPTTSPAQKALFAQQVNHVLTNLDQAENHLLSIQAAAGTRLNESQNTQNANAALRVQFQTVLSSVQDANYPEVITQFNQSQVALEAAQKGFVAIQGLSLFNFLK